MTKVKNRMWQMVGFLWCGSALVFSPLNTNARTIQRRETIQMMAKHFKKNGEPIKSALTSYMHFCAAERDQVTKDLKKKLGPDYKPTMVLKKLGELWRMLPNDRVAYYKGVAAKDKERFDAELAANGIVPATKKAKAKSNRPRSGYMIFCANNREAVTAKLKKNFGSDFKYTLVMKELGAQWQSLGPYEKQKFNDLAAAEKEALLSA